MAGKKDKHICTVECPHCAQIIEILRERETITPAVKAEHKDVFRAEKSKQTHLMASQ